jgi:PBSX family phage terminase large subunit
MFSPKQIEILKFPYSKYNTLIGDGAIRTGKTSVMGMSFISWSMNTFNGKNFGICGKTVKSAERNIIKELMKIKYLRETYNMTYSSSNGLLTIKRGNVTNYYYVFGGKDESSYQLIQGITLAGILVDEVALQPQSFVEQAIARCSVEGSKKFFNCNPESPEHWFLKEWIEQAEEKNALRLHFELDDNPALSESIKEEYRRSYTGVFYKRYILGLWVRAEGLVYETFANNVNNYIYDEEPKNITYLNIGVDFGGNKSKHTFVCTGFTNLFKEAVVLEDKRIDTNVTPDELDRLYVEFVEMCYNKYKKPITTYADSAEQVLIKGMKMASARKGLINQIMNARKNEIIDRIQLTIKLMAQGRFHIMRRCQNVRKALENAVWDSKHPDTRLDDGTTDIDTLDAMEYSIEPFMNYLLVTKGGM